MLHPSADRDVRRPEDTNDQAKGDGGSQSPVTITFTGERDETVNRRPNPRAIRHSRNGSLEDLRSLPAKDIPYHVRPSYRSPSRDRR